QIECLAVTADAVFAEAQGADIGTVQAGAGSVTDLDAAQGVAAAERNTVHATAHGGKQWPGAANCRTCDCIRGRCDTKQGIKAGIYRALANQLLTIEQGDAAGVVATVGEDTAVNPGCGRGFCQRLQGLGVGTIATYRRA